MRKDSFMNKHIIFLFAILGLSLTASAQTRKQGAAPPTKPQTQQAKVPASPQFQESWTSIPTAFKGDDFVALAKSLDAHKGEFESDNMFVARLNGIANKKEKYVFLIDSKAQYDANLEKYDVVFGFNVYDIYKNSISITDKVLSDAAGAKYEDRYRAVVTNESLYYEEKPTSLSIPPILKRTLAIPLAEAQKYKGKIKWALIVKLGPEIIGTLSKYSYIDRYETHNRYFVKVINLPTDKEKLLYGIQLIIIHNIFVNLESIWLYNDLDGKIIEKINIDEEMKSKIK